jgi:hypothetical protein
MKIAANHELFWIVKNSRRFFEKGVQLFWAKERYKSVTDPLIIPHRSRLSSAELPVLGGPQRSLLIDGANPYHFRSIQCFDFGQYIRYRRSDSITTLVSLDSISTVDEWNCLYLLYAYQTFTIQAAIDHFISLIILGMLAMMWKVPRFQKMKTKKKKILWKFECFYWQNKSQLSSLRNPSLLLV